MRPTSWLKKDRNFQWWTDYGVAALAAQTEAMRRAFTNRPIGKAFNIEHARVMKREKLVDLIDPNHPFPDPNSREDAMMVVENLHHPPTPAGSRASRRGVRR